MASSSQNKRPQITPSSSIQTTTKNDNNNNTPPPYPTGKTIPFPYSTPYPQQVGLMDAMLSTLRLCDDSPKEKKDAAVMLLESPTGTGKSLSLASAAVSWLRYREEHIDLSLERLKEKEKDDTKTNSLD
eukprot:8323581-Ditylum_brightwellii.AAC.1